MNFWKIFRVLPWQKEFINGRSETDFRVHPWSSSILIRPPYTIKSSGLQRRHFPTVFFHSDDTQQGPRPHDHHFQSHPSSPATPLVPMTRTQRRLPSNSSLPRRAATVPSLIPSNSSVFSRLQFYCSVAGVE
ncbi:hypothetical protein L1887_07475 [Cichorium endivia]|nr:hypothetical protein L1887_07475 [Cichorium endivia]